MKKVFSFVLLCAAAICTSAQEQEPISYVVRSWNETNQCVDSTVQTVTDYTVLTGFDDNTYNLGAGYYVVQGNIQFYNIDINDGAEVHLILCNNCEMTIRRVGDTYYNISLGEGAKLCIHDQPAVESEKMGYLNANGIVNVRRNNTCAVEIHGGNISARTNGDHCPGIGPRQGGENMSITIYGGIVDAKGGSGGAGIGSSESNHGPIRIYGGMVTAAGDPDGFLTDASCAGIGGGDFATSGEIYIYGGEVTAIGGHEGAGIGTSQNTAANNYHVYISGGHVVARGHNYAAGIGGGDGIDGATVEISGGFVEAYGGTDAAGIGGGEGGNGGKVTITGGKVNAHGNDNGAGIGGGEDGDGANVTITGGVIYAKAGGTDDGSRGIGPGDGSDNYGSLTIGDDMMVYSERKAAASERKPMCWYRISMHIEPCDHSDGFTYTVDGHTGADHHFSHCPYCNHSEMDNHHFNGQGQCTVCGVQGETKTVKLWMPKKQNDDSFDGNTYEPVSSHLIVPNTNYVLQLATLQVPNLEFLGWEATTAPTGDSYTSPYTTATADTLYRAGNRYTITDNISFVARYKLEETPTAIEETPYPARTNDSYKYLRDGILFIEKNGKTYNIQGALLK